MKTYTIKPLDWFKAEFGYRAEPMPDSISYRVEDCQDWPTPHWPALALGTIRPLLGKFDTLEAAQAACEADWVRRMEGSLEFFEDLSELVVALDNLERVMGMEGGKDR